MSPVRFPESALVLLPLVLSTPLAAQTYQVENLDPDGLLEFPTVEAMAADNRVAAAGVPGGEANYQALSLGAGPLQILPPLPTHVGARVYGANASGILCGASFRQELVGGVPTLFNEPVVWQNGLPVDIEAGTTGGDVLDLFIAYDTNAHGQVIGDGSDTGLQVSRGFLWEGGQVTSIGPLPGQPSGAGTAARAINTHGVVAGFSATTGGDHAFTWQGGAHLDLHASGGVQGFTSHAFDINDGGTVVGSADPSMNAVDGEYACIWAPGAQVQYLGSLGGLFSRALAINNSGDVVGWSWTTLPGSAGFLWTGGVLHNLNDLIPADSGWEILDARGIDEDGTIAAVGRLNGGPVRPLRLWREIGSEYCTSTPNSTGASARIGAGGSPSVQANDFTLLAGPVPNTPGIFFYGPNEVSLPFGDGFRCVGGGIFRLTPAVARDNWMQHHVDNTSLSPGGQLTPGSTWKFQGWFRDPAAGGAGFNLSDAVSVTFQI